MARNIKNQLSNETFLAEQRKQSIGENLSFAASEAYKLLRTNLSFTIPDEASCKVIGVTSSIRGEGKSTTSINLAYTFAQTGKKVLLIEGDLRIPVIAKALSVESVPGLAHVLANIGSVNDAIKKSEVLPKLYVMPAGEIPPNPSELLSSKRMSVVIETLSKIFDYIILDLPPVTAVSDALAVSNLLSGTIVVVRKDYCDKRALSETMRLLNLSGVKVLGFVFNDADSFKGRYGRYKEKNYKKYKSYYGYKKNYTRYEYGAGNKDS